MEFMKFTKGDYTQNQCEVWVDDEYYLLVSTRDADKIIELLNSMNDENEELKKEKALLGREVELLKRIGDV